MAPVADPHVAPAPAGAAPGPLPEIREVLFASDLGPQSDGAFDHARLLAERFGARLVSYHAAAVADPEAGEPERERWRRSEQRARDHLQTRAAGLRVPHEIVVERADSARQALLAHLRAAHPDLVVLAAHGREALAPLEQGRCPVLCVREPEHGAALPYRRVLVPTDLSEASRHAFPMAALLAGAFGAEVLAVHVITDPPRRLDGVPEWAESAAPDEGRVLRFVEADFAGARVTARVLIGSPWDRIVETARLERSDVIVMSTHGHDSLTDRVLGSHAERVLRHAPCPVLVT